jgi:TonB family protein
MKMKTTLITLTFLFAFMNCESQQAIFEYAGRWTPSIKKEKLNEIKFINELMPDFPRCLSMPYADRSQFDAQLKAGEKLKEYHTYPQEFYNPPSELYSKILYFISMQITTVSKGTTLTSKITQGNVLTPEQKSILNSADMGSDIIVKVKFRYKNVGSISNYDLEQIKEGEYKVTVVPANEVEYPGGSKEISNYIIKNVFNKIPEKRDKMKIRQARARFTINESGQVINVKIIESSSDQKLDKLFLDAINKMPKWKPAEDANGGKLQQEFVLPLGFDGC